MSIFTILPCLSTVELTFIPDAKFKGGSGSLNLLKYLIFITVTKLIHAKVMKVLDVPNIIILKYDGHVYLFSTETKYPINVAKYVTTEIHRNFEVKHE